MKIVLVSRYILVGVTFLFTLSLNSQPLTDAEKKELCKNNKARIAELEKQLVVINDEIGKIWVDKEIENALNDMKWVRSIKNVNSEAEWIKNVNPKTRIMDKTKDYGFEVGECYHNSPGNIADLRKCLSFLESAIGKRIDKAVTDQKKYPDLAKQKQKIENDLAAYKKRLSQLGCAEPEMVLYNNTGWEGP